MSANRVDDRRAEAIAACEHVIDGLATAIENTRHAIERARALSVHIDDVLARCSPPRTWRER